MTIPFLQPSPALYVWKGGQGKYAEEVKAKEQLFNATLELLNAVNKKLHKYVKDISGTEKWIDIIGKCLFCAFRNFILAERITGAFLSKERLCEVLVGVVGSTGSGKSTLINAALGFTDLLPTDDDSACTSAIIEARWSPTDKCQGEIIFLEVEEWQSELEQLYLDIQELDRDRSEEDEEIDVSLSKISYLFLFPTHSSSITHKSRIIWKKSKICCSSCSQSSLLLKIPYQE